MAQAFAHIWGGDSVLAYSAGSRPSGKINPRAIAAMAELGYDLSSHDSKSLNDIPPIQFDYLVTMGCGDACPWVPAVHRIDWQIPDPRDLEPMAFNKIRDLISEKVKALVLETN